MPTLFITGASGTVGRALLEALLSQPGQREDLRVIAGTRSGNPFGNDASTQKLAFRPFDFGDAGKSIDRALEGVDVLFLLRPPQMAKASAFAPVLEAAARQGIGHIVFLSVQGAENNRFIPHHGIEKAIAEGGIPYTFLRPAYFMQNFTTTLRSDLVQKQRVYLPAGKARFTLINVEDLGRAAAEVLLHPEEHRNTAYTLTNDELLTFGQMAAILSEALGKPISYHSPNPLAFYRKKQKEGIPGGFILVMIMLHFLPRFQSTPKRSEDLQQLIGTPPVSFRGFAEKHRSSFLGQQ